MFKSICLVALLLTAGPLVAQTAGPAPTQQLTDEIKAADLALFSAFFDRCDVPALKGMVTDDFEMFHDKGGRVSASGAEFIKNIEGTCARQQTGEDYRARRELIVPSVKVYPLNNYGAIEVGEHRFYQLLPDKPEKLVEISLFTQVWKKEGNTWKLARVLSYDHRLTE
jgi:ketosteroid isomerase-like protein